MSSNKVYSAAYLGTVPYELGLKLQQGLMQARAEGKIADVLLLLQHPPVFTIGRFRGEEDIIVPPETLAREGIWRQEGLKVPKKQPKRGRLWLNDGSCIRLRPEHKDHV